MLAAISLSCPQPDFTEANAWTFGDGDRSVKSGSVEDLERRPRLPQRASGRPADEDRHPRLLVVDAVRVADGPLLGDVREEVLPGLPPIADRDHDAGAHPGRR